MLYASQFSIRSSNEGSIFKHIMEKLRHDIIQSHSSCHIGNTKSL